MLRLWHLIGACFISIASVQAQEGNNVWVFGQQSGLEFSNGMPEAFISSIEGFGEANASISDADGNLLFYTEGSFVWDRLGNLMPNGSDLTGIPSLNAFSPTSSTSQGTLIARVPGQSHRYYIFSLTSIEQGANAGRLYYSVVDMTLNNGLGDVEPNQKGIYIGNGHTEKMTAVAGEGCKIWLLTTNQLNIRAYEVTESGVNSEPIVSNVGSGYATLGPLGNLAVSPDGTRLAVTQAGQGVAVFEFDNITGQVTAPMQLAPNMYAYYGAAFSPDNNKLYVTNTTQSTLHQFDLMAGTAADIIATQVVLGSVGFTHLKLGPDGRLYFKGTDGLGVLHQPNLAGAAAIFDPTFMPLLPGTQHLSGLPNISLVIPHDTTYTTNAIAAACFSTDVVLHAGNSTTGWDYRWQNGQSGHSLAATSPGTYWVNYRTPPCNYRTDTFQVTFPEGSLPVIATSPSCSNNQVGMAWTVFPESDTVTYQHWWLNEDSVVLSQSDSLTQVPAGNYWLHLATANCDTFLYTIIPEVSFPIAIAVDTLVCEDEPILFVANADAHYMELAWDFGDGGSSGQVQPSYAYLSPGLYEVMLVGRGAVCTDTTYRSIEVDPSVATGFKMDESAICVGDHVRFTTAIATTATDNTWAFGDGSRLVHMDTLLQHAYDQPGKMVVILQTDFRACPSSTVTDTLWVYAPPLVDLGPDTGICVNGPGIYLRNLLPATGAPLHYLWDTGDTTRDIRVKVPGTYRLRVSQGLAACSTEDEIMITKDCYIDVPNAFTPNGDGDNDWFFPRQLLAEKVTDFHMQVFNRWGQLIFETRQKEGRGWDGAFNGVPQPVGVYIYHIAVAIDQHYEEKYEGNVTLIR